MAKILLVHGMRMQSAAPDPQLEQWASTIASSLRASAWGKAHPAELAPFLQMGLAYWADLFAWPNRIVPTEAVKGLDLGALKDVFYKGPRVGLLGVDAVARHTKEGNPDNWIATFCDRWVEQTAVYMHNGRTYRPEDATIAGNPKTFGSAEEARQADADAGRGAYFEVQARFERALGDDTRIVIAHSLGTVIAYEALCRRKHRVHTFITIGSPMATPRLILEPMKKRLARERGGAPIGLLPWPGVTVWHNVCARQDVVCVPVPDLDGKVDGKVHESRVDQGKMKFPHKTHLLSAYLAQPAVAAVLAETVAAVHEDEANTVTPPPPAPAPRPRTGRRFFLGIRGAAALVAHQRLLELEADIRRMRTAFKTATGYDDASLPPDLDAGELRTALGAWCLGAELEADDEVVIYFTGHGHATNGRHYLGTRGFDQGAVGVALQSYELAEIVTQQLKKPGKVWLILDCCDAGDAIGTFREGMFDDHTALFVLASCRPYSASFDGAFSNAFVEAVQGALNEHGERLTSSALVEALDASLARRSAGTVRRRDPNHAVPFDFLSGLRRHALPKVDPPRAPRRRWRKALTWLVACGVFAALGGVWMLRARASRGTELPGPVASVETPKAHASEQGVRIAGGSFVPGTDEATARRMFAACQQATPGACGANYESSAFVRQVRRGGATPVIVAPFELDAHEVTREELAGWLDAERARVRVEDGAHGKTFLAGDRVLAATGGEADGPELEIADLHVHAVPGTGKRPASFVSWYGATSYCAAQAKGLPSEAQWEYAARGPEGRRFPWGDAAPAGRRIAYAETPCGEGECASAPVGASPGDVTTDGIFDLGGNVSEWTSTPFEGTTPEERASCRKGACRVVRGGTFRDGAVWLQSAVVGRFQAEQIWKILGFRCVREVTP